MIRNVLKKSYYLRCVRYLLTDAGAGLRNSGGFADEHGTTHSQLSTQESIEYIEGVFADYKKYSGVQRFHGAVAEVGPGDNCGVGLLCLADGCSSVDLADRFYSRRDPAMQAAVYAGLAVRHPEIRRILANVDLRDERSFPGITYKTGQCAAAEEFFLAPRQYDFIISRAVFEHLYDPLLALTRMESALKPGGYLLHKVDLRNHGLFAGGFHELKFLEVPDLLYGMMNRHSARPNRVLVNSYRKHLARLGLDFRILVTQLVGVGPVEPHVEYPLVPREARGESLQCVSGIRANLAARFRDISDEDLSVSGFFVIAQKKVQAVAAGNR